MTFRDRVIKVLRKKAKHGKRNGSGAPILQTLQDLVVLQPNASRVDVLAVLSRNGTVDLIGDPNEIR